MERKLGEVFEYNNVKLQVIEQLCLKMDRHDRKSVIFKEIKN